MDKYFHLLQLTIFLQIICSCITCIKSVTPSYSSSGSGPQCVENERQALLYIKVNLTNSTGRLSSWVGQDCCKWAGVECNNLTSHVVKLDLGTDRYNSSSQLKGMLSLSLLDLNHLSYLNLSGNRIDGKVPPQLGNLSNLHYLDLSYNSFCASDLTWLSGLTSLEYLNLGDMNLSATWPQAISFLPSLSELHLAGCDLEYPIPPLSFSITNSTSLSVIDLSQNILISEIPPWLINITTLMDVDLSWCNFTATVSHLPWYNLPNLKVLDLEGNSITDDIGTLIDALSESSNNSLRILNLGWNHFSGQLGESLGKLTSLTSLKLRFNSIYGGFPSSIGRLSFLEELSVSDNLLNESIKESFGRLSSLSILDLSNNKISGSIPVSIGELSSLSSFYLSNNTISGSIPVSIGEISSLSILDLSENEITGSIPSSFGKLSSLTTLDLSNNELIGSLPSSFGKLSSLTTLYLSHNKMNGSIPENFGELSLLTDLDLSDNYWKGKLTELHFRKASKLKHLLISSLNGALVFDMAHDWIPPFSLEKISISGCLLGPAFPPWIQTQTEIYEITLSNGQISGTIPDWVWNLLTNQVNYLNLSGNGIGGVLPHYWEFNTQTNPKVDLSYNNLHGTIPLWSNLSSLLLRNNSFSGPIPREIGTIMSSLIELDLSSNSLNGTIPKSIGTMENLNILDLSNNKFSGQMLDNWNSSISLVYLDLSKNNLFGEIPLSICSLSYLMWLDLSDNSFNGMLPLCLQECNLYGLNLGRNRLSGNIPRWKGITLKSMQLLKLGMNVLSGEIHEELCDAPFLHALDLSHNNLSGNIPACFGNLSPLIVSAKYNDDLWWEEKMDFVLKGKQYDFFKNQLRQLNIIDLSGNKLTGEIPEEITNLVLLDTLNISRNRLRGKIPEKIGKLWQLEALDLSYNNLSGRIPVSLAFLTMLSHLDLSFNNLSGQIPTANQFSTFSNSIYEGNPGLCGDPLPNLCYTPGNGKSDKGKIDGKHKKRGLNDIFWYGVSIGLGFIMGFWGLVGSLVIKRSWRIAYFKFFYGVKDRLFVFIAVKTARFKRTIVSGQN